MARRRIAGDFGLVLLLAGLMCVLAGCGSDGVKASELNAAQIAERITDEDPFDQRGTPSSVECVEAGGATFSCVLSFDRAQVPVEASIVGDDEIQLGYSAEHAALCEAAGADVRRFLALLASTDAADRALLEYTAQGGMDPATLRALQGDFGEALATYADGIAGYRPRSDWGRDAKPALLSSARGAQQALRDLLAGEPQLAEAADRIVVARSTFDDQIDALPCVANYS